MATQRPEQDGDRREARADRSLREQILLAKQELTDHFHNYHRMLDEREQALMSELDAILISVDGLLEKRRELKQTQGELEEKMKKNEFRVMKDKLLEVVNTELCQLERQMSETVELEWRDSELLAAIRESYVVLKRDQTAINSPIQDFVPYSERLIALWSVGTKGSGDGQLNNPKCVAVDTENNIYIADLNNHRIAIFTKDGLFVKNFTVEGMWWLYGIVIISEFCYISTNTPNGFILKVNKKTGQKLSCLKPGVEMVALTLDKETGMLFACPRYHNSIWHIEPDNLEKNSELTLHTPHFKKNTTKIYDIKTLKDELYVLFFKSPYPLQSFNREGNLLRTIISQDSVSDIFFFCIDIRGNFIISDDSANKILVFSLTGNIIARMGRGKTDREEAGEVYSPSGVAVTKDNRIIICDGKLTNNLQLF